MGDDFNRYAMEHVRGADREDAWQWICWCPMRAFAYLDGERVVEFVGRAEAVDDGLAELSLRLGLSIRKAADANANVPPDGDRRKDLERYDRATLGRVNEAYAEDFERFGYARVGPAVLPVRAPRRTSAGA